MEPDQSPKGTQEVAPVVVHRNTVDSPDATEYRSARNVIVGGRMSGSPTKTVTDRRIGLSGLVQSRENTVLPRKFPVKKVPENGLTPLQAGSAGLLEAVQLVTLSANQVSIVPVL